MSLNVPVRHSMDQFKDCVVSIKLVKAWTRAFHSGKHWELQVKLAQLIVCQANGCPSLTKGVVSVVFT